MSAPESRHLWCTHTQQSCAAERLRCSLLLSCHLYVLDDTPRRFSFPKLETAVSSSSSTPTVQRSLLRSGTSATFDFHVDMALRAWHPALPATQDCFTRVPMRGYHSALHCAMVKHPMQHKFASCNISCRNPGHLRFVWHKPRRPVFPPQLPRIPVSKLGPQWLCRPHYSRR